jgi:MoaA/NifB/PqqE/SkfB family radical SAM enzyme
MPRTAVPAWRRLHEGLNNRLRTFAGGRFARFCRPVSIAFLLTERCNARCVHCDIWKNKGKENSPGIDEWMKVLRELRSWLGPVGIVFTGGEALLYPQAIELVQHAISLGFSLEFLTHGYWSDQAKIERLAHTNPWRITVSVDGVGAAHSKIRGREDFFERTRQTLDSLVRIRSQHHLTFRILLKTVVMEHNLDDLCEVARFATRDGVDVLYQPIEQNYNTPGDPLWFQTSGNWPRDPAKAVHRIQELAELKRAGLHIANSEAQFEAMIRYFQDPAGLRLVTQAHVAHERKVPCCALTMLQFQANGDVTVCANRPPIGNIRVSPVRQLWKQRPRVWENGCCLAAGGGL